MITDVLKYIFLAIFSFGGGVLSAAGLFAIMTSVGLLNRFAKVSKTTEYLFFYEEMIIVGATLGNLALLFEWKIDLGALLMALIALVAGVFIGSFIVCLAETLKALPIFIRRVRIANGLGYIILALALGKGVGNLIYQFILYQ